MNRAAFKSIAKHKISRQTLLVCYAICVTLLALLFAYQYMTQNNIVNADQAKAIGYGIALKECVSGGNSNCESLAIKSGQEVRPGYQDDSCSKWDLRYVTRSDNKTPFLSIVLLDAVGKQVQNTPLSSGNGNC